jgi:hypothetical protein
VQEHSLKRRGPTAEVFATLPGAQRGFVAIGQTPPGSFKLARDRAADISLMFALLIAAAVAGGSIYEAFVLFPAWSGSSAAGAGAAVTAEGGTAALSVTLGQFWLACYSAGGASLLLALVLNWGRGWRRAMLLLALAAFAAMRAWTYFALRPELDELLRSSALTAGSVPLLIEHVLRWSAQNRWRELSDGLVVASLAIAFSAPTRRVASTGVRGAAGAYRKASK